MNESKKDIEITLSLLQSIAERPDLTQRKLSKRLGLALGLTNGYLKRCITNGLIKVEQIPANRYLYHLTSCGLSKKSQLLANRLSSSMSLYRQVRLECKEYFNRCLKYNLKNIAIIGSNDLSEVAYLTAKECGLNTTYVTSSSKQLIDFDGWVVSDPANAQRVYDKLKKSVSVERICCFSVLGVKKMEPASE